MNRRIIIPLLLAALLTACSAIAPSGPSPHVPAPSTEPVTAAPIATPETAALHRFGSFAPNTVLTAEQLNAAFSGVCPITGCSFSGPVNFTTGGALVLPVWVSNARPGSPAQGQIGYASDIGSPELYTGTSWQDLGTVASITAESPLTGGTITRSGTIGLGIVPVTLGGTDLTGPYTDGQLLIGDSSSGGLDAATLTPGNNITLTFGHGGITIAEVTNGPSKVNGVAFPTDPGSGYPLAAVMTGAGVINYETLPIGAGGTGATTAATAAANLGVAPSSATGTVSAVTGSIVPGDAPVFTDNKGTIGDSGIVPGGSSASGGAPQGRLTLQSGSPLITTQEAISAVLGASTVTASYAPGDTVTLTGGTETVNAVLSVTNTDLYSVTPLAVGTGYFTGDTVTLTGGTFTGSAIATISQASAISVAVNSAGTASLAIYYTPTDTITLTGGTIASGSIIETVLTTTVIDIGAGSNGTGCTNESAGHYTLTGTDGTGTKWTATAGITSNAFIGLTITGGGSYTVNPAVGTISTNFSVSPSLVGCSVAPSVEISTGVLTASTTTNTAIFSTTPSGGGLTQSATSGHGAGATFTGVFSVYAATLSTNTAVFTVNATTLTQSATSGAGTGVTFTPIYQPNALTVATGGIYSAVPPNSVSQGSTSGSGAGAKFTMSWAVGMTGATAIYYQPFGSGQNVPVWLGTSFGSESIGAGLSLALDSNSGHTGYQASGNVYDIFAAMNGSTLVIGTGPAWSSTGARGTGAGTTQLAQESGIWVNANAITLRYGNSSGNTLSVPADEATYLGSMYATANGQTRLNLGCYLVAGGGNNVAGLYNAYNRLRVPYCEGDSTTSWSYTAGTWRGADSSTANRITFLDGLGVTPVGASYSALVEADSTGIDIDSSTATPMLFGTGPASLKSQVTDDYIGPPQLGLHYLQAMELGTTSGLITGNGQMWLRANLDN
jgi:hypothetical protein